MKENNKKNDLIEVIDKNKNKQIILYGAASRGVRVLFNLIQKGVDKDQILFCDTNSQKWGKTLYGIRIISIEELKSLSKDVCIIISSSVRYEIFPYLEKLGFVNIHYFHSLLFVEQMYEKHDSKFLKIMEEIGDNRGADNEENYTLYSSLRLLKILQVI